MPRPRCRSAPCRPRRRTQILRRACPGAGGCGIAASFNTWGIAMEAIGLMLPYSSSIPAVDAAEAARNAGGSARPCRTCCSRTCGRATS